MAGWMNQIGIKFDLCRVVSETKAYVEWENGTFDAYIWSWGGDPDPDFNMSVYITSQCLGWSDGCYSNPELDKLYNEQRNTFDRDERQKVVSRVRAPPLRSRSPRSRWSIRDHRGVPDRHVPGLRADPPNGGALLFGWRVDSYMNLKPVVAGGTRDGRRRRRRRPGCGSGSARSS